MSNTQFMIYNEMYKMLLAGKTVIIEQADGSKFQFKLEDMSLTERFKLFIDVLEQQVRPE